MLMSASQAALRVEEMDGAIEPALTILVTDRDGAEHRLAAIEGWRAMEVIRDWGLDMKAECGGACACATCHVHVDPQWATELPPPSAEEIDMLDGAFDVRDTSRLSCQILLSQELNGLRLRLAPGTER
jgi:2Fe-2S ferredoxin